MVPLETPRLLLRLPEASDAEPFMEIFWDPEVVEKKQVTLTEAPGDIDLARRKTAALLDHCDSLGYGLWTVVEKASGQVIGCVGLQRWKGWPGVELAWDPPLVVTSMRIQSNVRTPRPVAGRGGTRK